MKVLEIIEALEQATESDRLIDAAIAKLAGYEGNKPPYFTRSHDAAITLAEALCPGVKIGCGWERGKASAKVGDGPICQSSTIPLALCLAALRARVAAVRTP